MITDTYPLQKNNSKNPLKWKLFGRGIIVFIVAIIALWFILKTCNPTPSIPIPQVTSVPEIKERVRVDSIASQKYQDSVNKIVRLNEEAADYWENKFRQSQKSTELATNAINTILNEPTIPDTCKSITDRLRVEFDKAVVLSKQKDIACNKTIAAKNGVIREKDVLIKQHKKDYTLLRQNLDTCLSNQTALEKYIKKVKPRSEIFAGISALGSPEKPLTMYGINLGLRNKKGTQFEIGAYQFNSQVLYQVGIKKTLFRL